ncbi:uncharacterized protein [Dendropsophus ebraccatus]|uniref:uncharacterized protein n=1 Tax=Dendropsophus ebraccatus TaxID=150705 RepID=UPI003831BBDF
MRTTTILRLILGCLLHITWGSAFDPCFKGKVLPFDVENISGTDYKTPPAKRISQINGLWNLKALVARTTLTTLTVLNNVHYSYAKLSLTEKEGTITEFFNPMEGITDEPIHLQRVSEDVKVLTFKKDDKEASTLITIVQLHSHVLMINRVSNGIIQTSALYVRARALASNPPINLEEFKEWGKCKELTFYKEFDITNDYANTCPGLLEIKTPLNLEESKNIFTTWHLVAKSQNSMDQHYNVRILYTARLEISKTEGEITLKEIITAPQDNVVSELKFGEPTKDGNIALIFHTDDELLLLGVQTNTGRTLYLASKTPTVKQFFIKKFEAQAFCFETKFNYIIPGSSKDNGGAEACSQHLKQWVPSSYRDSLGKWVLMATAYESLTTGLDEQNIHKEITFTLKNNEVHQDISIKELSYKGFANTNTDTQGIDVYVEKTSGQVTSIVFRQNETTVHTVSPNCKIISNEKRQLLYCRENQVPTLSELIQFVKFSTCRDLNKILIHSSLATSCSEIPAEISILDVEKIAGTWNLAAVATNITESNKRFPHWIRFTVKNGEVTLTEGTWTGTVKKIGNNRLQYTKDDGQVKEMKFHESLGDSLLISSEVGGKTSLALLSKSNHASPKALLKFRHLAACTFTPVVFLED